MTDWLHQIPPGVPLIVGALMLPLIHERARKAWMLLVPLLGGLHLFVFSYGDALTLHLFGYELTPVRVDKLSVVFGIIFHICAFLSALYALHVKDTMQNVTGLAYAGSAIAAAFAGDLITLFVCWELTAITSVFLIWASRTERSYRAGMRYLIIQVGSGVLVLAGVILHYADTGSLAFHDAFYKLLPANEGLFQGLNSPGTLLIFLGFGIKAAFPFLHNWLQDAYPQGTVTGTVFLSAFTTKLAIYALARGFPGTGILVWLGTIMTLFPVFYAVIENDLRKVLAYSLNNQLGFMVVGIGVGTAMSLNGTVSHAFAHIIYKALLFMSMGAVLYRVGTVKATELGGLYKSMPFTTIFCIIGAASISGFPFLSGFVTKSMVISEVGAAQQTIIFIGLLAASAGVMEHSGIKIPYFAFFGHDSGKRCKEAPWNMLVAMGISAVLCILIGVPGGCDLLYGILPHPISPDWHPFSGAHIFTSYQLLVFAILAFVVLVKTGVYPPEVPSVNLDSDWFYRKAAPGLLGFVLRVGGRAWNGLLDGAQNLIWGAVGGVKALHGPGRPLARTIATGIMVLWVAVLLGVLLILYFIRYAR